MTLPHQARSVGDRQVSALAGLLVLLLAAINGAVRAETCQTMTTFNAALTPRISNYEDRVKDIPLALLAEDADVVCLQEYWFEADIEYLLSKVAVRYPFHFSGVHNSVGELTKYRQKRFLPITPCDPGDVLSFWLRVIPCGIAQGCLPDFLRSLPEGLACAASRCESVLKAFKADCLSCIVITATTVSTVAQACKTEGFGYNNRLNKEGLVILSKHEILTANLREYFPGKGMTIPRGYIEAEIKDLGLVVCSHFSSVFPVYFEYSLNFTDYVQQQQAEIAIIQSKFSSRDHIVIGDFNTGPSVQTAASADRILRGEASQNYQLWLDAGYNTSYVQDDGRCTYCADNPLVSDPNNAIDFVMFKGDSFTASASQRTLEPYPPLSDHYGVRRTVCAK